MLETKKVHDVICSLVPKMSNIGYLYHFIHNSHLNISPVASSTLLLRSAMADQ